MEDHAQGQNELKAAMTILMMEVKNISAKVLGENSKSPIGQISENREQSVVEQIRSRNTDGRDVMGDRRQSGGGDNENNNSRVCRLDFPIFSGEDPDGWISKAERYFEVYHLSEVEKLGAGIVGLEGDALHWFQWMNKRHTVMNWRMLRRMMLKRFRGWKGGSIIEQ